MSSINIIDEDIKIVPESFDKIISVEIDNKKIWLVGIYRHPKLKVINELKNLIQSELKIEKIRNFFLSISGEYCLINKFKENIRISLSYSCPQFYLSKVSSSSFFLTQNESDFKISKFKKDNLILRCMNDAGYFVPGGVFSKTDDFLLPGMEFSFKKNKPYELSWILPIEDFCTRDDHKNLAKEIADAFVTEMESYKTLPQPIQLELSAGIDSALMLAAAVSAGVETQPTNYKLSHRLFESQGANNMAKYFNLDLRELSIGPTKNNLRLTDNTNIYDYLDRMEPLLKVGSGATTLNNISLLSSYKYGAINTLENSSYAIALCIMHYTSYPTRRFLHKYDFKPKKGFEKRYSYSFNYSSDRLTNNNYLDEWGVGNKFSFIAPYYWEFLEPCFTGTSKKEPQEISSELIQLFPENLNLYHEVMKKRGFSIIDKIIKSSFMKNSLKEPSAETAGKLSKLIVFINNLAWSSSKMQHYRSANLLSQYRPGLSSIVLTKLFQAKIDKKLVNYPKWHIFEAFKLLAGKDFFDINKPKFGYNLSINNLKDASIVLYDKLKREYYSDFNDLSLTNISVKKYLNKKKIPEIHNSIMEEYSLKNVLPKYEFIYDNSNGTKKVKFEYLCNILNLSILSK